MTQDKDLITLQEDARWEPLWKKAKENYSKKYNLALEERIDKLYYDDQKYRAEVDSIINNFGMESPEWKTLMSKMEKQDSINKLEIEKILETEGWPGENSAGRHKNKQIT
jgi:hypothetical protein